MATPPDPHVHDVRLHGGPADGTTFPVEDPWPRETYLQIKTSWPGRSDQHVYKYLPRPDDPWDADWVAPWPASGDEYTTDIQYTTPGPPGDSGPAGPTGPPGPQGAEGPQGVSVEYQGPWDGGVLYTDLAFVTYNGSGYVSIQKFNQSNQPDVHPEAWALVASKGATGAQGPQGTQGIQGVKGDKGDPGSPLPPRQTKVFATGALNANAYESGSVGLAIGYRIIRVQTDRPAWVRLYTTQAKRDADTGRDITADPSGDHGCVVEIVTTLSALGLDTSPVPQGYSMESVPTPSIPYRIQNRDSVAGPVNVTLVWQAQES